MSGEQENDNYDDNDDFLDDFVLDESDVQELLSGQGRPAAPGQPGTPGEPLTEEDLLFTDHSSGLGGTVSFQSDRTFSEAGGPPWDGDGLELDSERRPSKAGRGSRAQDDFGHDDTVDLSESTSPLQAEDEFALDSEQELEIVGEVQPGTEAEAEGFDTLDSFLVEDEQEWAGVEDAVGASVHGEVEGTDEEFAPEEYGGAEEFIGELTDATAAGRTIEEGWEPLPGQNLDQIGEVDELDQADEDGQWDDEEYASVTAGEDHDIYADVEEDPGVVGTYRSRRRLSLFATLAAALLVVAGATVGVLRPDWLGLRTAPHQVEVVRLQRPQVRVEVTAPPMPVPSVAAVEPRDPNDPPQVAVGDPPVGTEPVDPGQQEGPPAGTETPGTTPTPGEVAVSTEPEVTPVPRPEATNELQWPVAVAGRTTPQPGKAPASRMMRAGNDLLIGDMQELPSPVAVEGVTAGVRAFAQLENGNYFIGSVKTIDPQFLTLRMADGEISLPRESISTLAELGSADYDVLQRATSGFVRLTNSNRLIGGILRTIADDHVVLESKSNRVMLPRSAIEEIVEGGDIGEVRIGTTSEEEEWLRRLSERQLGGSDPRATHAAPGTNGRGN